MYKSDMNEYWVSDVRVNSAGVHHCEPGLAWDSKAAYRYRDWDLWGITRGRGVLKAGEHSHECVAGGCFILRPWERYTLFSDEHAPVSVYWAHYDRLYRGEVIEPTREDAPVFHRSMSDIEFFSGLLERLVVAWCNEGTESPEPHRWLSALLMEIGARERTGGSKHVESRLCKRLDALCAQIRESPGMFRGVAAIAADFHWTPDHFTRVFKLHVGVSPSEYVVRSRIEAARRMLRSGDDSIGAIAESLGYCDQYFFSRQFKNRTGLSPLRFRNAR